MPPLTEVEIQRDKLALLGQLTAGIAHDLNNPIGYISSNLNALGRYVTCMKGLLSEAHGLIAPEHQTRWQELCNSVKLEHILEDLTSLLTETREGSEHLKSMVADLKYLGRARAEEEMVAPDSCIRSALNLLKHHLTRGVVEVEAMLSASEPLPMVRGQIIQLVANLAHNAIQAMPKGGRIRVTSTQDGPMVEVLVEDSGPGIPAEIIQHIFDPFFTTKAPGAGTGLGLAIARKLAQNHGGDVTLIPSTSLGGACFRVRLQILERPSCVEKFGP